MSILKYIDRLKRMDELIRRRATGSPEEFAKKIGVCKSMLMLNLAEIKEMGASVKYNSQIQSYYYEQECRLDLGFSEMQKEELQKVKGGKNLYLGFFESNNIRMAICKFDMQ